MSRRDIAALIGGAGAAALVAVLLFWLVFQKAGDDLPPAPVAAPEPLTALPFSSGGTAAEVSAALEVVSTPEGSVNADQRWSAQSETERQSQTAPAGPGAALFYDTPTPVSMYRPPPGRGLEPVEAPASADSANVAGLVSSGSETGPSEEPAGRVMTLSPADMASAMDPSACGVGPAGDVQAWVVWRDGTVGVCFRRSVMVVGNIRLWGDGVALDLTGESRAVFEAGLGSRVVWFDRMRMPGEFYAEGWRRDRDAGERVVFADGAEIDYDLPDTLVSALPSDLTDAWRSADYEFRVESVSRARDRLVVRVLGAEDVFARMSARLSDPLGREGCAAGGVRSAPVLADESGAKRATFSGYVSSCLAPEGVEPEAPYELRAELLDVSGSLLHAQNFGSDDFDIELAASSVSYGAFGDALVRAINMVRANAGLHPVTRGERMVAQRHAEDMVENCYASHWDRMGLKPYMRYALEGGIHANSEIWVGTTSFCVSEGPERVVSAEEILALAPAAVALWSESPEHAAALLNPDFRVVSHGLAYDERNWRVVAVFETALAEDVGRALSHVDAGGRILTEGSFTEKAHAAGYRLARAEIRYEPPFGPLGVGRLARTAFYSPGRLSLVVSDRAGSMSERVVEYADPHLMGVGLDAPPSEAEAAAMFEQAKSPLGSYSGVHEFVPVEFRVDGRRFGLTVPSWITAARLCAGAAICASMSPGVYTITLVASAPDGRFVEFGNDVVWFGVDRPPR